MTIKHLLLWIRQEINNRNCRVRQSRRGCEVPKKAPFRTRDTSCLKRCNHYPGLLPCTSRVLGRQGKGKRESLHPVTQEQKQNRNCFQTCGVKITNTVPQCKLVASSQEKQIAGCGAQFWERGSNCTLHTLTRDFTNPAALPYCLPSTLHTPSASCPPHGFHHQ